VRTALITDAMAAAGMADGAYRLGGLEVRVRHGVARLAQGDSIAGSTLTLDAALRRAVRDLGLPIAAAARAAATTPARALGLGDRIGALEPGKDADLVILGDDLAARAVMAKGEWVGAAPTTARPAPSAL
jgi:N-acetylglucosamine-6-phosphate deacetylase